MASKLLGCGVPEHDIDCLCDVKIVGEPTKVTVTIPDDFFAGKEICEMYNLGVPWTGADLATFFEKLAEVYSYINRKGAVHRIPKPDDQTRPHSNSKLNIEQMADLKDWIRSGGKPTELRNRLFDVHGIKIHKSYISKMRSRMMENGEL